MGWELDGRKPLPINCGPSKPEDLLLDASKESEVHGGRPRQYEILINGIHWWIIRLTGYQSNKDSTILIHLKNYTTFILPCPKDITNIVCNISGGATRLADKFDHNEYNKIIVLKKK